ncbi:HNH endonuclease [Klebsiella variicola]
MPPRAKRPCRHRGCTAVTNDVGGYCEMHRQQHAGDGWRNYQPGKTRQERGYGRPWEIKRARIMKRDKYLCQNCRRDGIATKASSVDHIIPKAHGGIRCISTIWLSRMLPMRKLHRMPLTRRRVP